LWLLSNIQNNVVVEIAEKVLLGHPEPSPESSSGSKDFRIRV